MKLLRAVLVPVLYCALASQQVSIAETAQSRTELEHQRHIALEGAQNFRDLGGYQTNDGSQVRWGKIYRSDQISKLTDADYAKLRSLHIGIVYDLRQPGEREHDRTDWRAGSAEVVSFDAAENLPDPLAGLREQTTPDEARQIMFEIYRVLPEQYARNFALMLERLAANDHASLVHCTAGKDRTGFASALLLTVLGVPYQTVRRDYELTEAYVDPRAKAEEIRKQAVANPELARENSFFRLPEKTLAVMMRADPAYLDIAFESIRSRYGSIDGYVQRRLGVSEETVKRLRRDLLERN